MNRHRKIQTVALASLLTAVFVPSAFAQQGGQLPSTVPSQQMQTQPVAPMPPAAAMPMEQQAAPVQSSAAPPSNTMTMQQGAMAQPRLSQHPNAPLQPKQVGDVTYITGGVGDNEMDQLKSEANNYNFQLMNSDGTGHFIANNDLVISSRDGHEMIRVDNTGPLFYAQLPPGEYKVEINHGDRHETKTANISSKGKPANVYVIWK